ncbi:MAG TPA: hypothetical protein VFE55_20725 [Acidimicrobiia bacterium]|nr:hypothetical protein [Acidimicrobiia bacterium]
MALTTHAPRTTAPGRTARAMLNKVPEVTVFFWIIKVLATTVGETAADYLNEHLGLGLTGTTLVMSVGLVAVLLWQFRTRRYVPKVYWSVVVLISVVGTLASDNLVDNFGVPLVVTTPVFAVCLAATFFLWFRQERTLSIHTIHTTRREAFYWATILFTFALGTSAGDLVSERLSVGYWRSGLMFAALIAVVAVAHLRFRLGAVLAFWSAYVLTRPLGASFGDYLTSSHKDGGLGLGTNQTSLVFVVVILALVAYLTKSKVDSPITGSGERAEEFDSTTSVTSSAASTAEA